MAKDRLTEKQLIQRAEQVSLALFPRYDANQRRVYDICARDKYGRPDLSQLAKGGLANHCVDAFLAGVAYREALGWENEDADT